MSVSVKPESCPRCHATVMENLVRVEQGKHIKVHVRCAKCKSFVARYTLERYTTDKTYDTLLKELHTQPDAIIKKELDDEIEVFNKEVEEEFLDTIHLPVTRLRVEELIAEMMVEGKTQED